MVLWFRVGFCVRTKLQLVFQLPPHGLLHLPPLTAHIWYLSFLARHQIWFRQKVHQLSHHSHLLLQVQMVAHRLSDQTFSVQYLLSLLRVLRHCCRCLPEAVQIKLQPVNRNNNVDYPNIHLRCSQVLQIFALVVFALPQLWNLKRPKWETKMTNRQNVVCWWLVHKADDNFTLLMINCWCSGDECLRRKFARAAGFVTRRQTSIAVTWIEMFGSPGRQNGVMVF